MISVRTETGEEHLALDEFESRVRKGLIAPNTPVRLQVLTGDRWVDARELELFQRLYAPARIHFSRSFSLGRFPVLTTVLCVLQIVIYFGVAGAERFLPLDPLIEAGAKVPANILELGETWRLVTANLLHRDILHLLFNMFFLFNVGGTIENAYRLQDYLLILVASAIATTVTSTLLSSVPSVGASGMVLGLFGSASVFGYKYGDILPERYRRYFGGAALPYALFILYVGLASKDTDNWGHLGGLIGGLVATMPLEPRLLHVGRTRSRPWIELGPALVSVAILVGVFLAGPVVRLAGPSLETLEDLKSGIRIAHPERWTFGENHLGYPALGNGLGASIGVRAERNASGPMTLIELKRQFLEKELERREEDGDIAMVSLRGERPFLVKGGRGLELGIALESRAGPQVTRNILIERGFYTYRVVMSAPQAWAEDYGPLFDRMQEAIALLEPEELTRTRRLVETFPGMSSAHVALGDQLAAIGEVASASRAYRRALDALPEQPEALYGLVKLASDYGGDLTEAVAMAEELHERAPEEAAHASLLAEIRQKLGQVDGACAVLQETLDRMAEPPEDLRDRLRSLRCRSADSVER